MSVVFVSTHLPQRDYSRIEKSPRVKAVTFVSYGEELDIELIAARLIHCKPDDVLALDGPVGTAAICLTIWLEINKDAKVARYIPELNDWATIHISRASLRIAIEQAKDKEGTIRA